MLRLLLFFVLASSLLALAGCQTGSNPFGMSPTQIPPPPTGAANRNDPYYQPNGPVGRTGSAANPAYTARSNQRRARFTSDQATRPNSRDRYDDYDDGGEPERLDTLRDSSSVLPTELPVEATGMSNVVYNKDLPWSRPNAADAVPASAYESTRPRPRFR